jgi:hypothetical protein
MAFARIYRKDLSRITVSHNRLGLYIKMYGLVAKINDKRKSRTCEDLSRISIDHSRSHRVLASSDELNERASMCLCFFLSPLLQILT